MTTLLYSLAYFINVLAIFVNFSEGNYAWAAVSAFVSGILLMCMVNAALDEYR